jgi:hypothetical protein
MGSLWDFDHLVFSNMPFANGLMSPVGGSRHRALLESLWMEAAAFRNAIACAMPKLCNRERQMRHNFDIHRLDPGGPLSPTPPVSQAPTSWGDL